MSGYDPDGLVWKPNIPEDRKGARVRYFESGTIWIRGAGEVTFTVAGGSERWFVWRSHFGSSPEPHRTRYFANRRQAVQCWECLLYCR